MARTSLKTKQQLARWRSLGALYDFEIEHVPGSKYFTAVFMNLVFNYRAQREFDIGDNPLAVLARIEKICGGTLGIGP